jgi:hypothetical protein
MCNKGLSVLHWYVLKNSQILSYYSICNIQSILRNQAGYVGFENKRMFVIESYDIHKNNLWKNSFLIYKIYKYSNLRDRRC